MLPENAVASGKKKTVASARVSKLEIVRRIFAICDPSVIPAGSELAHPTAYSILTDALIGQLLFQ